MNRLDNHYDSAPSKTESSGNMAGFDAEFTDLVDYILRITYRIWEGKQVGLCYDYYSDDCPVYTLAGITIGAEEVVQNTLTTLSAFPDRTLHADNIIWGGDAENGFYSSHRIKTHMTNLGTSDLGPATGKEATIAVIAHCVVKDNKVIEEWLVRDNYSLAEQLGFDPLDIAQQKSDLPPNDRFVQWKQSELERLGNSVIHTRTAYSDSASELIVASLQNIWNARMVGDVFQVYAKDAALHASANRERQGHEAIVQFYMEFLGTLSSLKLSVDYVCEQPAKSSGTDVAARWTMSGLHTGPVLWGEPSGSEVLIIGESHYRVVDGLIEEEWTVFDELSILVEINRARNTKA